ncbi:MAG: hypothetical protein AB7E67_01375 [Xanthobacteraceae bacterium]
MKKSILLSSLVAASVGLGMAFAPVAYGASHEKGKMEKSDGMKKDAMKKDSMKKDSMKKDDKMKK